MSPQPSEQQERSSEAQYNSNRRLLLDPEERLSLLESNVRDYAIFTLDTEGEIASWSAGAQNLFGYTEEEAIGQPGRIIFTPEDIAQGAVEAEIETAATEGASTDQRWHVRKDGTQLWADGILTALRDPDGRLRGFAKIVRDFTDRHQKADELNAANARMSEILESITDAFYAVDDQLRFTYINRKAEEWWGRDRNELIGRNVLDIFPKLEGNHSYEMLLKAAQTQEVTRYEIHSTLQNRWLDVRIYPTKSGVSVYFADIDERKRAEQELKRQAELIDLAHDAIMVTDLDNRVLFWSRGSERKYGWTREEASGQVVRELLKTVYPESYEKVRDEVLSSGVWEGELVHTRRNGSQLIVASRWALQRGADGKPVAVFEINRDITRQKQLEEERAEIAARQARIAEMLQRSLLLMPTGDAYKGLTIESFYEAASTEALVGGDFADVFAVDPERVALVIGDVTGKGLVAATYTAEIKYALRAILREYSNPAIALERLNNYLITAHEVEGRSNYSYVAMALAVVDRMSGEVVYCSAGTEPAVIVRAHSGNVEIMDAPGLIVGAFDSAEYENQSLQLSRGDLFALTTDGITEARDSRGEFLEMSGFASILRSIPSNDLPSLDLTARTVVDAVRQHAGGSMKDDVCLLLARKE